MTIKNKKNLIKYIKKMDSINSNTPIIIDFGTSTIRVGFKGQEKPTLIFPNILGEIKYQKAEVC